MRLKIPLFARIVLRLTLPLFFLGLIFAGIQLTTQMGSLNESHRLEGQWAFSNVYTNLLAETENTAALSPNSSLQNTLGNLARDYHLLNIGIFDALQERPLFESSFPWGPADLSAIQKSLREKKTGTAYSIELNKETRQLIAYMPLPSASGSLYIARAILPLAGIREALEKSALTLVILFFAIFITGIFISIGLAKSIINPIRILNKASREMMEGRLGMHVDIKTGDEIEELAHTFNQMSDAMRDMKAHAEDANPLTGLPGNKSIFSELRKRIHERQKFVAFHVDLDRFKIFNDHYGLAKGDMAIVKTAGLLKKIVTAKENSSDFFGHQGGDDFMVITQPKRAEGLGAEICKRFDAEVVRDLYSREDMERGHTLHLDRRRQAETGETVMREFPLLSISVAGVSSAKKDFADYLECMNLLSEVKKEVKKIVTSSYLVRE